MAMLVYQRVSGKKNTHVSSSFFPTANFHSRDPPFLGPGTPCLPWPPLSSLSTFTLHKGLQMAAVGLIQLNPCIQCRHLKVIGRSWLLGVLLGAGKHGCFERGLLGKAIQSQRSYQCTAYLGFPLHVPLCSIHPALRSFESLQLPQKNERLPCCATRFTTENALI